MRLRALYHDVDRLPYLLAIRDRAHAHGLDLELTEHQRRGDEDWAEVLRRGETDLITESYWRLQRYRADGVPFVALASAVHAWTELLLARPSVRAFTDLRGKRIAVRGTGPQTVFPRVLLRRFGMEHDVEFVVYKERETGRWEHWKAVADGACDACFVLPLYADAPLAAGLLGIPYPAFAFDGAHVTITTTESALAEQRAAFAALLRAMFEATALVRSDPLALRAHVAAMRELLSAHFALDSEGQVVRITELLASEVWESPVPTIAGLENALALARENYRELEGFNPLPMWDFSLAREAGR